MRQLWNKAAQFLMSRGRKTGLEQELNRADITGKLAVPEIAAAARQMAADGIVVLKNQDDTLPIAPRPGWRYSAGVRWTISPWATAAAAT